MDRKLVASILTGPTWRDTAVAVREALRQDLSLEQLTEQVGIAVRVLHQWVVACDVYDGIDRTVLGEALWSRLDENDAAEILYALRQIPRDDRSAAVRYLLERGLSVAAAESLVQAIKDYRRLSPQTPFAAFTREPGDALALQKWRRAQSAGDPGERRRRLEEGLALAATEAVRALFRQALDQERPPEPGRPQPPVPRLPVRSMGADAPWPRPVPYADDLSLLDRITPATFPTFTDEAPAPIHALPAGRYIALPAWPEVIRLRRPVAVACAASALPFPLAPAAAPAGAEAALLVVETEPADPEPGTVVLVHEGAMVRATVVGVAAPFSREAILGTVVLALRRGPGNTFPSSDGDIEADFDCMD